MSTHMPAGQTVETPINNKNTINILLVEDDRPTQMVYQFYLKKMNYQMELVATGNQAIQCVKSHLSHYYDAMILDLGLPDIGGEVVLQSIRDYEQQTKGKPLPIIITTAHSDETILETCRALGADWAFTKPVALSTFQKVLPTLINAR